MTYFEFKIDGSVIVEAESETAAKNKFEKINGWNEFRGKIEEKTGCCDTCGTKFKFFYFEDSDYCSSACYWKDSDGFYWDKIEEKGVKYTKANHNIIEDNELAKKKGII